MLRLDPTKNIQLVSRPSPHRVLKGWELVFHNLPATLSEFCVGPLPPHQMIKIVKVPIAIFWIVLAKHHWYLKH